MANRVADRHSASLRDAEQREAFKPGGLHDGFQVAPGQNLNGHLTLGENSADNAGIRISDLDTSQSSLEDIFVSLVRAS